MEKRIDRAESDNQKREAGQPVESPDDGQDPEPIEHS